MVITIGVSLYSTRLVLNALGAVDFGIYNLIAGIIVMLSFLNSAMSTSTQRYLSYYQGKKDESMQRKVFSNSLILHIIIGLSIVGMLELGSLFIFDGILNIPLNRLEAAKNIYHFMSVAVFFTIVAVPFSGLLISHENIVWVALINIIETLIKLGIAIGLYYISKDKLITYGCSMALISAISLVIYLIICLNKYKECTIKVYKDYDKPIIKELGFFASWNLFGALCSVGKTQGLAIILNVFLGTLVNAAYGIANQVSAQMNFFSSAMLQALNPQIMKSEGAGDRSKMLKLSMAGSKFAFFLLAFIAIPAIFEIKNILELWLKNVPPYTVTFCQLILIGIMTNQLTIGLQSALQATGKIKTYQTVVGGVQLLTIPLAFLLLKLGLPDYSVLVGLIVIEFIACILRIYFLHKIAGLSISEYLYKVILKEVIPVIVSVSICWLIVQYIQVEYRFLLTFAVSIFFFFVAVYFFGLSNEEKNQVKTLIKNKLLSNGKVKSILVETR
ncbi:hypothetical protein BWI96_12150 [Siphonobacter sp. SORGH_AS_0500]|nr:hypothetical protein BWI96_12150 [Siphonobacter sp. SORGH_AS_0500]